MFSVVITIQVQVLYRYDKRFLSMKISRSVPFNLYHSVILMKCPMSIWTCVLYLCLIMRVNSGTSVASLRGWSWYLHYNIMIQFQVILRSYN